MAAFNYSDYVYLWQWILESSLDRLQGLINKELGLSTCIEQ